MLSKNLGKWSLTIVLGAHKVSFGDMEMLDEQLKGQRNDWYNSCIIKVISEY